MLEKLVNSKYHLKSLIWQSFVSEARNTNKPYVFQPISQKQSKRSTSTRHAPFQDLTHHSREERDDLGQPDGGGRVDDPDVHEDVGKVDDHQDAQEAETDPPVVVVN